MKDVCQNCGTYCGHGEAQWQPIETAPKTGRVLLYLPNHYPGAVAVGVWNDEWTDANKAWAPTHWMHLPAAPKGTQ